MIMNYIGFIGVLVHFINIIIFIKADDGIQTTFLLTEDKQNISVNEGRRLQLLVKYHVDPHTTECWGSCNTSSAVIEVECTLDYNSEQLQVIVKKEIKKEDKGMWTCDYKMHEKIQNLIITVRRRFYVDVTYDDPTAFWYPIIGGIAVLVLLIIIGQAICITHLKKKAAAIQRQIEWSNTRGSSEDTVRYSKMPTLKNKALQHCKEDRESGIYEALDFVPVPPVPEPPPLATLPCNNACIPASSPPPVQPASSCGSFSKGYTNGVLFPFSSLSRKKNNTPNPDSDAVSKTSSLDQRIQARLPMPLPHEEVYEAVMETTPPAFRKDFKPKEVTLKGKDKQVNATKGNSQKEEFRGFQTQPKPKPPPPEANFGGIDTRNAQVLQSQIMQGFKTQLTQPRLKPPPPGPKFGSTADIGNAPVLPSQIKQGFRTQPKAKPPPPPGPKFESGSKTMETSVLPSHIKQALELQKRGNALPQEGPKGMVPLNSGFPPPMPGPSGVAPPALRTIKPPPSPASGTSTLASKWKPPPPSKPKQLHPLPPPPKPEPIHVATARGMDSTDDEDEEWTYEPLDKYQLDKTDHDRTDDDDDEWNYEPLDKYHQNIYNI